MINIISNSIHISMEPGSSWPWSHGSWIYDLQNIHVKNERSSNMNLLKTGVELWKGKQFLLH